jgi:hypothetical protein
MSDFQGWLYSFSYYFGHIILFSIELGNMSMFQDHEVCYSSAVIAFHVLLNAILILLRRVYFTFLNFIILQKLIMDGNLSIIACFTWIVIYYCNQETMFCVAFKCKLRAKLWSWIQVSVMETIFFQVYLSSSFLNTSILCM